MKEKVKETGNVVEATERQCDLMDKYEEQLDFINRIIGL